ncbi:hypothetical protein GJ744_006839 [Endocarpon pusillum]|uniref:Uncharacterized protein n=1 Tax=Endocarpon pusillum TaxID=364733 RepID=A0A8H7E6T3_9EURO|nr:hypothetical protein GJ744_006839 [Endocarpon pusillum]
MDLVDAALQGSVHIIEQLLDKGADVKSQDGRNALQVAASGRDQEIVTLLLDKGADVNAQGGHFGNALQAAAAADQGQEIVTLLLDKDANVNAQGGYYGNALQAAAFYRHQEIVTLLLDKGADVNAQGGRLGNALQAAACRGDQEIVTLLLDKGADVNTQGGHFGNALQAAAAADQGQEIVTLLLDKGANVNAQGGYYGNALQAAAFYRHQEIVTLLLDKGADVNAQGGRLGNALQAAACRGDQEIITLLLDKDADVNAQGGAYGNALQAAASEGDQEIIRLLLDKGADVNAQGGEYGNALQAAASEGHQEIVTLLLDKGADVNAQGGEYGNALQAATYQGHQEIVTLLLDKGADVNAQDSSGQTPLHTAVEIGNVKIAQCFLDKGASPDVPDLGDVTSFQSAVQLQHAAMVLLLLQRSKKGFCDMSAADWRRCLAFGRDCHLEIICGKPPQLLVRDESLKAELEEMSYPLSSVAELQARDTDFMSRHGYGKRLFIFADDSLLRDVPVFSTRCRWWRKVVQGYTRGAWHRNQPEDTVWAVQTSTAPSIATVQRNLPNTCFLECALSLPCLVLPRNMQEWPDVSRSSEAFLRNFEKRQAILWIMVKPTAEEAKLNPKLPILRSKFFFSTSEYAGVPDSATDLFVPLVQKICCIWRGNFEIMAERLASTRGKVLRWSGNNPSLIRLLLEDAQLLELLKSNLKKQVQSLLSFHSDYDAWGALHEQSNDLKTELMNRFKDEIQSMGKECEETLAVLWDSSQNIIQLEFNLTSITEAQKSTSTNRSMKRLSWITFVFLPMLFIASLFGMNVDILGDNPPWWWYIPFAGAVTILTFAVWVVFKRSQTLEDNLEKRFEWLFGQRKVHDVEADLLNPETRIGRTAAFPAFGKKRL